jgi:hypothetical protein
MTSPPAFPAKLDGTSGHIILEPRNDTLLIPQMSFVPVSGGKITFTRAIDDIVEIKKVGSSSPLPLVGLRAPKWKV